MPKRGLCKLCLEEKDLQDSHMIPRALYKLARQAGFDPVVMTRALATHTSRQIHDFVLCWDCEQRFSQKGEDYVMTLVPRDNSFPLLNRLAFVRVPTMVSDRVARYATTATEIDTRKMAYFALSVFWRAAIHPWATLGVQSTSFELPAEEKEPIRKFLRGEAGFPAKAFIVTTVCLDEISQGFVLSPFGMQDKEKFITYTLLVRGLYFRLIFDASFRDLCCMRSAGRYLFVDDDTEETIDTLRHLRADAKVAQNLKRKG
jgi:hypothetical protein